MRIARLSVGLVVLAAAVACANSPAAPGGASSAGGSLGIIGGAPTGSGSYRSVGALLYDFDQNGIINANDLLCTASLIAPTVVLTAGHCHHSRGLDALRHFARICPRPVLRQSLPPASRSIPAGHDQSDPSTRRRLLPAGRPRLTPLSRHGWFTRSAGAERLGSALRQRRLWRRRTASGRPTFFV
jgi:hypothetical protein